MKIQVVAVTLSSFISVVSSQSCTSDADCLAVTLPADGGSNYCAQGTCTPVGQCTSTLDCFNPSNSPYAVLTCAGYLECNDETSSCGQVCANSGCAGNVTFVACDPDALPCGDANDIALACPEAVSCVNDPCSGTGSCTALYFDATGNQVCASPANLPEPTEPQNSAGGSPVTLPICVDDTQCGDGNYCAGGNCLPDGACYTVEDCKNPNNGPYAIALCVGPLTCTVPMDTNTDTIGQCGIFDCNGQFCADGSEPIECEPCDVTQCSDAVSCAVDNCGGSCTSIYYGADGSLVCTPELFVPGSCDSDADCTGDFEFCMGNTCVEGGACGDLVDCYNPSNLYGVPACVGTMKCTDNQCGIPDCNGMFCEDGEEPQENCPDCDVSLCSEAVSCAVTSCGSCKNHYFDAAGNQVCKESEPSMFISCMSDADCNTATSVARQGMAGTDEEYYCAQGSCRPMGSCGSALDCNNPSNIFPMIECVGHLYCDDQNLCAVECGPGCADGSEWQMCDPSPCNDPANPCPQATSCYSDLCNGCNAIFLDAAGKNMTADCPIPEPFDDPAFEVQDNNDSAAPGVPVAITLVMVWATIVSLVFV